jgi:hypothetical protein
MFTNRNEYLGYLVLCAIQWGAPSSVVQLLVQGMFAMEQDPTQHNTTRSMPHMNPHLSLSWMIIACPDEAVAIKG